MTDLPTPGPIHLYSTTINHCNWLLDHAVSAARQCEDSTATLPKGESEEKQKDALTSILFSVAATEAFINELVYDCQQKINKGEKDSKLKRFTWALRCAEESNSTTKYKFELAHLLLTGEPPKRDRNPFADFYVLFGLRNDIMHIQRPDTIVNRDDSASTPIPKRVENLIGRGLTRKMPEGYRTFWLIHLMTARVAWWACNAASDICKHIALLVPNDEISSRYANNVDIALQDDA